MDRFGIWLLAGIGIAAATTGWADADESGELAALEKRIAVLEQQTQGTVSAGPGGFALKSMDGSYQLKFRGYVQADARFFLDDNADNLTDSFLLRRVRPILEGQLGEDWTFRIMPDFGGGKVQIVDMYLNCTLGKTTQVRGGKFKAPFGLERLQQTPALRLAERAYPSSLSPNRDVGLQLSGEPWCGVQYAVGVFNGVADGGSSDSDGDDGKDAVGRLWLEPFRSTELASLKGLGIGIAGSFGDSDGTALSSYKSIGQANIFSYAAGVTGDRRGRWSPQLTWYWGPFGLIGEYAQVAQEVNTGTATETLNHEAWQLATSWVVTGEANSFKLIDPERGWGAVELVARVTALDVDDDAFPVYANAATSVSSVTTYGVGVNWYASANIKVTLDYEQSAFDSGAAGGDRADEKVVTARWQALF